MTVEVNRASNWEERPHDELLHHHLPHDHAQQAGGTRIASGHHVAVVDVLTTHTEGPVALDGRLELGRVAV